jgi:hypothetical protein
MSFLDPFLDAFSDIGDSVGDFAESDEGKLAMILAAAYLTGGTSLGASGAGAGTAGAGTAGAMGSWDVLPAVAEGVTAITPQTIGAQQAAAATAASTIPTVPTISPVGAPPGITSLPPSPTNAELLSKTGWSEFTAPDIGTSNVTALQQGAGPISEGTQVADLASKGSVTFDAAGKPIYTSGTLPPAAPQVQAMGGSPTAPAGLPPPAAPVTGAPTVDPYSVNANYSLRSQAGAPATNSMAGNYGTGIKAEGAQIAPPSMFDKAAAFAQQSPWIAGGLGYLGAYNLGLLDPRGGREEEKYNGVLTRYKMSPDFQASNAQPNVYKPTYAAAGGIMQAGGPVEQMSMNAVSGNTGYPQSNLPHVGYASPTANPIPKNVLQGGSGVGMDPYGHEPEEKFAQGGIAHFRRGGNRNLADSLDFYKSMTEPRGGKGYSGKSDPGAGYAADIYYDMDPDTRYQDALTAAQIRQAKINKRANVEPPVAKRPTPMGQLNLRPPGAQAAAAGSSLDPEMAAQGGIMHSSLGGYAAGGNPRLLRGPGDGMSDNIPATIANKQPARLADGEFVIPADVVSHLGNGSTEAGAKRLHEMMNKVRKARTGNQKQGKQINPNKFMPA